MVAASRVQPDIALIDIQLAGGGSGIETAELLWEAFRVPTFYMTGYHEASLVQRVKQTTPLGYLIKPFFHQPIIGGA